jgi:hypothetical protein
MVTHSATEELVDWHAERLSLNVPQREIKCTERVNLLTPRRIEIAAVHC